MVPKTGSTDQSCSLRADSRVHLSTCSLHVVVNRSFKLNTSQTQLLICLLKPVPHSLSHLVNGNWVLQFLRLKTVEMSLILSFFTGLTGNLVSFTFKLYPESHVFFLLPHSSYSGPHHCHLLLRIFNILCFHPFPSGLISIEQSEQIFRLKPKVRPHHFSV